MPIKSSILIPIAALSFTFVNPCSEKVPPKVKKPASGERAFDVDIIYPKFVFAPRSYEVEGVLDPSLITHVTAPADGVIDEVSVAVGDKVNVGDPVVTISNSELTDRIENLHFKAKEVAARLKDVKNKLSSASNPERAVTNEEVEFLDEEPAPVAKSYGSASVQPPQTLKDLADVLQAMVDRYNAEADDAEKRLSDLVQKSPVAGVVLERLFNNGNRVKFEDKIVSIAETDPMSVTFRLPEDVASYVDKHSSVTVSPAGAAQATGTGQVYFIAPDVDSATRSIEVRAHVSNPDNRIKGGQKASVKVATIKSDQVLVVPPQAVTYEGDKAYLFVVYGNQVRLQEVVVGKHLDDGNLEIPGADVRVDDPIVVGRPLDLKNNSFVNISKEIAFEPQTAGKKPDAEIQ